MKNVKRVGLLSSALALSALSYIPYYRDGYQIPREQTPEIDTKLEKAKSEQDLERVRKAQEKRARKAAKKNKTS